MPEDTKKHLYKFQYESIKYKNRLREGIVIKYYTYHSIDIIKISNFITIIKEASLRLS